jgi:hypothetical protein
MQEKNNALTTKIKGHVRAFYKDNNEVVIDKFNAVHPQNMATVIARGLANDPNQQIFKIVLGNGGTDINSSQNIVYNTPNIIGTNASLYNETYSEIIDELSGAPSGNSVISANSNENDSAFVICTVQLSSNEPSGQASTDGVTTDPNSPFTFDELGLMTQDGLLLSHIVFNPIEKNAQRELIISYTLTITVTAS